MIQKILFATDLGAFTHHSLAHVEELALSFGAKVSIVHAVNPIGELATAVVRSYSAEAEVPTVLDDATKKRVLSSVREHVFEMLLSESGEDDKLISLVSDIVVAEGHPANVILNEAGRLQADLIVVGNHSCHAIDNKLMGSVASKVLHLAKVPVYLVPMMDVHTSIASPLHRDTVRIDKDQRC